MLDQAFGQGDAERRVPRRRGRRQRLRQIGLGVVLTALLVGFFVKTFMLDVEEEDQFQANLEEMSAERIIQRYAAVSGGVEAQMGIRSLLVQGRLMSAEEVIPVRIIKKSPNLLRMEYSGTGGKTIQAHDGNTVWMQTREGQVMEMEDAVMRERFLRDAPIQTHLLLSLVNDYPVTLNGVETVDGAHCYSLSVRLPSGDELIYFIDMETYLERKVVTIPTAGQERPRLTLRQSGYEKIDGFNVPHRLTSFEGDRWRNTFYVDSVTFNAGLLDSFFAKP